MLTADRLRFARTMFGTGDYGGWKRDVQFTNSMLKVWKHAGGYVVVLEPGTRGLPATLRIMVEKDGRNGPAVLADCRVINWQRAITILHAFMLVPAEFTDAYRHGQQADGCRVREATAHV